MRQIISKICTIIAILFIFPLMFKTNMCHITLALRRFKLSLIVKRCQGRVVISLFSNIHVYRLIHGHFHIGPRRRRSLGPIWVEG